MLLMEFLRVFFLLLLEFRVLLVFGICLFFLVDEVVDLMFDRDNDFVLIVFKVFLFLLVMFCFVLFVNVICVNVELLFCLEICLEFF